MGSTLIQYGDEDEMCICGLFSKRFSEIDSCQRSAPFLECLGLNYAIHHCIDCILV